MAQRSDRLEAAKAIAARLKAGAAVTEPALEHQRTGTAGALLHRIQPRLAGVQVVRHV